MFRFVIVGHPSVPLEELVPALFNNLPLKEDKDEYEAVFKALATLYAKGRAIA